MFSRKKRLRYKSNAQLLSTQLGIKINLDSWEEIWDFLESQNEPEYVYVISDGYQSVKIGRSVNPGQRLKSLQTSNPLPLKLLGYCPNVSPLEEKELHKRLRKSKIQGEWFKLTPEVIEVITEIKSQPFVVQY